MTPADYRQIQRLRESLVELKKSAPKDARALLDRAARSCEVLLEEHDEYLRVRKAKAEVKAKRDAKLEIRLRGLSPRPPPDVMCFIRSGYSLNAVLSRSVAVSAFVMKNSGMSTKEIAAVFGLSAGHVSQNLRYLHVENFSADVVEWFRDARWVSDQHLASNADD